MEKERLFPEECFDEKRIKECLEKIMSKDPSTSVEYLVMTGNLGC